MIQNADSCLLGSAASVLIKNRHLAVVLIFDHQTQKCRTSSFVYTTGTVQMKLLQRSHILLPYPTEKRNPGKWEKKKKVSFSFFLKHRVGRGDFFQIPNSIPPDHMPLHDIY